MRNALFGVLAAAALLGASPAGAYEGGWYVDNNAGGREILYLGDNSDNTYRVLRGTGRYCVYPGASYAKMRGVLGNEHNQISWWVTNSCDDGYVRVCVENSRGQSACSTYIDAGWAEGDEDGGVAWNR